MSWALAEMHGIEVAPGFFNIYNTYTGQSKRAVFHPESGLIFKTNGYYDEDESHLSKRYLGDVDFDGVIFPVRLPYHETFVDLEIHAQEYVYGEPCDCENYCDHIRAMNKATGYGDCHRGNWKISNGEVILFDFDGISA